MGDMEGRGAIPCIYKVSPCCCASKSCVEEMTVERAVPKIWRQGVVVWTTLLRSIHSSYLFKIALDHVNIFGREQVTVTRSRSSLGSFSCIF
jgi:hypothetical protein